MTAPRLVSAGIVPVRLTPQGWRLLVLRAYRNWDFPKGRVESGEDPFDTAKRETAEETGISDLEFAFGEDCRETLPYAAGKIARYFIAATHQEIVTLPISAELRRPEHDEWRWVSFEEAEELLPPRLAAILEWVRSILPDE